MQDRKKILTDRGWTEKGAEFLLQHSKVIPRHIRIKLFGSDKPSKDKCQRCGYVGPALDWHHVHGRKKSDEVIVLCANCHREVHAEAE